MKDERPIRWRPGNQEHLFSSHSDPRPTIAEIEQAMLEPSRVEGPDPDRPGYFTVVAQLATGRWIFVAWVVKYDGRYPVHARYANRKTRRRYG